MTLPKVSQNILGHDTSLPVHHCLLQPKKKNHKMMMSQKACCHFLQPNAKNHKIMMNREVHRHLLQLKKKKPQNDDELPTCLDLSSSSTIQEKTQKTMMS
jgi:hypothetical protein